MIELTIKTFTGDHIKPLLSDLAHLRIDVFREYPYLYDGNAAYEEAYLKSYADCHESLVVAAFSDDMLVGASTGLPMVYAADEFQKPFEKKGFDISKMFYFGESVMKKSYRGTGIYARFFAERESYARSLNRFDLVSFCAVERPEDHPKKPHGYRPLDSYWKKRGYEKHWELVTDFFWKDLDEDGELPKPMVFWLKKI